MEAFTINTVKPLPLGMGRYKASMVITLKVCILAYSSISIIEAG